MKRATAKPGWKMSENQWAQFWRLWGYACSAQGWDRLPAGEREAKRREILAALGFESAKDIDMIKGYDRVKAEFQRLASDIDHNEDKERIRLLHGARTALADLEELNSGPWVETFLKTGFGLVPGLRVLEDLPADQLRKVIIAANGRAKDFREAARSLEKLQDEETNPF